MKAAKGQFPRALDRPDPLVRFYLFHGPDDAGSGALAVRLLRGLGDAEKYIVAGGDIRADPATLPDEAGAMALFGGPRAIWIEPAGEEICEGVAALLDAPASESAVIALAGTLRKSSGLLKLAESHPLALSHCAYVPEGRDMERVLEDAGREVGLRLSPDVSQRLFDAAAGNQAVARRELEKFAIYLGASMENPRALDHDTIDLIGADAGESDWLKFGDLALAGRLVELVDHLQRIPHGGSEAIPVVRSLQRRLLLLAGMRARIEQGEGIDGVMTSMGKMLFWKDKPLVRRLLVMWSAERIEEAVRRVALLERELLLEPVDEEASVSETLVTLARAANARR